MVFGRFIWSKLSMVYMKTVSKIIGRNVMSESGIAVNEKNINSVRV